MNMFDHIDDYMAGALPEDIRQQFESALKTDEELKHLVDNYDQLKHISDGLMEAQLLDEITRVAPNPRNTKFGNGESHPMFYLFAALLIGAFLTYYYFNPVNSDVDTEESIEMAFNDAYQEPIWPVSRTSERDMIGQAASAYLAGDLSKAKTILIDSVDNAQLGQYWLAEMYLKELEPDSALVYVPDFSKNHQKYNRAIAVKAYSYLLKGDRDQAKIWVDKLPEDQFQNLRKAIEKE